MTQYCITWTRSKRILGAQVKGTRAQVIFFSVLPVRARRVGRSQHIMQINTWCHCQGFGFYGHGMFFNKYRLLGRGGIHLSRRGRRIFSGKLADLVTRNLLTADMEKKAEVLHNFFVPVFTGNCFFHMSCIPRQGLGGNEDPAVIREDQV